MDDANRLSSVRRWANADHLYGLAAECGLKRLMLAFGMPFDATKGRPTRKEDRVHVNGAWTRMESYRCGYAQGTGYVLPADNPFTDWNISDRYAHQSDFDEVRVRAHKAGATAIGNLIRQAKRQGLLP